MNKGPLHGRHIGRSWVGHPLEDECPCPKAPCGLAIADGDPDCPQHGMDAHKTLRQIHDEAHCPNRNDGIVWVDMEDGIHQKGMRVTVDDGLVTAEGYVRDKPGVFTRRDYLRTFGHDD